MKLILTNKQEIDRLLKDYQIIYNEYGKPYIKENKFYFNKSHTKNLCALIIDDKECGIDIEQIRKYNEKMANKILSNEEIKYINSKNKKDYFFTLIWTLKESYLKALGTGINVPLKNISFVKNNKIRFKQKEYNFKIIRIHNYIVTSCRKD